MNAKFLDKVFRVFFLLAFLLTITGIPSYTAKAQNDPRIGIHFPSNQVHGYRWPLGTPLTVDIDDPSTTENPDATLTKIVGQAVDNPDETWISFDFNGLHQLKAGDIVTMTNGLITKIHTVSSVSVTNIDLEHDTISGIAEPNRVISVNTPPGYDYVSRHVTSDDTGDWVADFSVPGSGPEEQQLVDFRPGSAGVAEAMDDDSDSTYYNWRVPDPRITVRTSDNRAIGSDWPWGAMVNLTIDDPDTPQGVDYEDSKPVVIGEWWPSYVIFDPWPFEVHTGQIVTLSDGTTTKELIVSRLDISTIDTELDRVTGIAEHSGKITVAVHFIDDTSSPGLEVNADQNGDWVADFAGIWDITTDHQVHAYEWDEDGDATMDIQGFSEPPEPPEPPSLCEPGNTITGTVFEHDGITPVPSANIQIDDYNSGAILFTSTTDEYGYYGCSLPEGEYRIAAGADSSISEYYNEAVDTNASRLQITTGTQLTNINFTISLVPVVEHFTFNLQNPLLQNPAVRKAIAFGTDRQRILEEAFLPNGFYGMVSNSIVPPEHWASAPASELTIYPYDPVQARANLEAAGWIDRDGDGFRENAENVELALTFKTRDTAFRIASGEIFRETMENIGIRIYTEYSSNPLANFDFDITEFAWAGGYDNEPYLGAYVTNMPTNYTGYSNLIYDMAIANARATMGDAGKLPYLFEAQSILTQDLPVLPLFTRYAVTPVTTPTGTNISVSPESYLDIEFGEVTHEGVTTVLATEINPADVPPNFQLLGEVYDIGTSAQFTNARVCFTYDDTGLLPEQESTIRLFHLENNAWADVTNSGYPDTVNNQVCGTVTSFSPFAIMYANDITPPVITWVGSITDGDNFYFSFVPPAPTCTATDDISGVDGACTVTGYTTTVGTHTLIAIAKDKAGNQASEFRTYTILGWTLNGFYSPVNMDGVFNIAKNGSTVPLKFEIFAGATELTDITAIKSFRYAPIACDASAVFDEIEMVASDGTLLRFDLINGQFIYNWKTPRTAGTCYRVNLTTLDGSSLAAFFKLQ